MDDWLYKKFIEYKAHEPELFDFQRRYLGDFKSEYPQVPDCFLDVFVVAENYNVFRTSRLPQYYRYLPRLPDDIRGRSNCTLILLGRHWRREDWSDEILDYCSSHNIKVIKQDLP